RTARLVTVRTTIQPPQNCVGRLATGFFVLERQPGDGIEVLAAAAEQKPHDQHRHESHDEQVTDENHVSHRPVSRVRVRPSDCKYATTASSSVLSATAAEAPSISSSVYGCPSRRSARKRASTVPSSAAR